jgi:hypothetical protein
MIGMLRRICLGLLMAGLAHTQIANLAIEDYRLPNGMEGILHLDRKAPLVHLNFRYRAGAKHEGFFEPVTILELRK